MSSSTMYKMKPVFDFPSSFKHTSPMYQLKNIQFTRASESTNFISENRIISANYELTADEKMILSRQEKLLTELSKLKDQIDAFRIEVEKLKTVKPSVPKSTVKPSLQVDNVIDYNRLISDLVNNDIVINADPKHPPYVLLGLTKIWKNLPLSVSIHIHSSISILPPQLKIFDNLKKSIEGNVRINVILVWKNVDEDCQLIISPVKSKIILGEVNLLRFFNHYSSVTNSLQEKIITDNILDISHRINYASNQKKQDLIKELSEILGNKNWFSDRYPTMVDLSVWSSFMRIKRKDNLPQNLSKFIEKCNTFFGVA